MITIQQPLHSDVIQGDDEARNEPYKRYGEVSTGIVNAVGRRKLPAQPAVLAGRGAMRGLL